VVCIDNAFPSYLWIERKFLLIFNKVNNNTRCSIACLTYIIKLDNDDGMHSISSTVLWWFDNFASDIAQLW